MVGGMGMIFVVGRRIFRTVIFIVVLVLILPVVHYYSMRLQNPRYVLFEEPRGNALKVSADLEGEGPNPGIWERIQHYLHEFYQNGL
jgi:hypothetical protein